ncbi:MAG: FAD-dependent monooxygenase [Pseudomonadota bacterium]
MTKEIDIAVIGGGIAGLSAAIAIAKAGFKPQVFEAAPVLAPLGTSLSLWPNAMACLADWGVDLPVRESGQKISALSWRRPNGRPYFVHDLSALYREAGQTGVCIRRSDLHDHLLMSIDPAIVHLGEQLTAISTTAQGVKLTFENGNDVHARHVVAADGAWSKVRDHVFGDGPPKYAGYGAWLGLSSAAAPEHLSNEGCEYIGSNGRFGVFETGKDTRYWFFVANNPTPTPHARPAKPDEVLNHLSGWPTVFADIVSGSHTDAIVYTSFHDRPIAGSWGNGPITLIGDAMHPFVPNLGQGACQAIEDAWFLGAGFKKGLRGDPLNDWMKRNRDSRLHYMRKTAQKVGRLAQSRNPFVRASLGVMGFGPMQKVMRADLSRQFTRDKVT